ncbi:MAG: hypothetical protein AAGI14_11215 [Pseudomonadota bacterium]
MSDFDREALVAAANAGQDNDDTVGFWAMVISLPIIGVAIGAYFMTGSSHQSTPAPFEITEPAPSSDVILSDADLKDGVVVSVDYDLTIDEQPWSASLEMARYQIVMRGISECSLPGKYSYDMMSAFRNKNAESFEKLRAIKTAEWKAGRSERQREFQRANNEMMVGLFTGETQMKAIEQSFEMQRMLQDMEESAGQPTVRKTDPAVLALLGGEPDLAKCSKLKADVQRGRHDIKFEARG